MLQSSRPARTDSRGTRPPSLVCICGLCECGDHKCSDFNDWLAARNGPQANQIQAGDVQQEQEQQQQQQLATISCGHSCSYSQPAPVPDERYLTQTGSHVKPGHPSRSRTESELRDRAGNNDELVHVLVTRPQVAAKPRDNIIFEGDMDLRTTFETTYEALARTRLEQWKRHQEAKTAPRDVSDSSGQATTLGFRDGQARAGRDSVGALGTSPSDVSESEREREPLGTRPPNARMIGPPSRSRSPATAEQSKQGQRLAGPLNSLGESEPTATTTDSLAASAAAATALAGPAPPATVDAHSTADRSQQEPFIDPDLSPIIVYDANLNRLERVGLRKRSKYRPSTSLRPGGRGFSGPAVGGCEQPRDQAEIGAANIVSGNRSLEPNELMGDARTSSTQRQIDSTRTGAGASSQILNRNQSDCGRKHHLNHVNRVDHIKEMSLVDDSPTNKEKEFADFATSTSDDQLTGRPAQAAGRVASAVSEDDADERQLAQAEEDAAVAEIQRLTLDDNQGIDQRLSRQTHTRQSTSSPSRQSSRLLKQTTISDPSETVTRSPVSRHPAHSSPPTSTQVAPSRQSRMERVCQNQSFHLYDNDYPETRGSRHRDEPSIKIGGRETVDLPKSSASVSTKHLSSQSAHIRKNLFRESPDFMMITGQPRQSPLEIPSQASLQRRDNDNNGESSNVDVQDYNNSAERLQETVEENGTGEKSDRRDGSSPSKFRKCPVLDLTHDFDFVGSRLGHKYFVEKHSLSSPISEMG